MNAVWHCVTPAIYGRMNYAITARYMYAPPSQLYYDDMCLVTKALSHNLYMGSIIGYTSKLILL